MSEHGSITLTARDYSIIEDMLHGDGGRTGPHAFALRRKLEAAVVQLPDDIDADVVTLNSRVRFRIDGGRPEERTIVASPPQEILGLTLLVWTSRGLALLGMRAGQETRVLRLDGNVENISVEAVPYQPEAHRRQAAETGGDDDPEDEPAGTVTRLSSYRRQRVLAPSPDGDDWGPGAA